MPPLFMIYPATRGEGKCRSCQAPIVWAELTSGKKHPFNAPLTTEHAKEQHRDEEGRAIWALDPAKVTSHFVTCPDRREWRKPKVRARQ